MIVLWHGERPIGVCVFCAPAASLRLRHRFFGRSPPVRGGPARSRYLRRLNARLWLLARVVLHPAYRGAGVAAAFVRRCCELCPVPWVETLSALGHVHPLFERAGFARVGVCRKDPRRLGPRHHAGLYGRRACLHPDTTRKSQFAEPVYYVFDNRRKT